MAPKLSSSEVKSDNSDKQKYDDLLLDAIERDNLENVRFALSKGADIKAKDEDSRTLLMTAVDNKSKAVIPFLIEKGIDVNAKDKDNLTALMIAAGNNHKEIVEILIKNGADINAIDDDSWTALMYTVSERAGDSAEILIKAGADVNAQNDLGSILMLANTKEMAELLIKYGADVNAVHKSGSFPEDSVIYTTTPLIYRTSYSQKGPIEALVKNGAKETPEDINCYNPFVGTSNNSDVDFEEGTVFYESEAELSRSEKEPIVVSSTEVEIALPESELGEISPEEYY